MSSALEVPSTQSVIQWNDDDDNFLSLHNLHGMPKKDTIKHYVLALPHLTAPQIYGRWSFWKSWLPEDPASEEIYTVIRLVPRAKSKKRKKREEDDGGRGLEGAAGAAVGPEVGPSTGPKVGPSADVADGRSLSGPFTVLEDQLYLQLLREHGKPVVKNRKALQIFCDNFPSRIVRSIQSHVGAFVWDDSVGWNFKEVFHDAGGG